MIVGITGTGIQTKHKIKHVLHICVLYVAKEETQMWGKKQRWALKGEAVEISDIALRLLAFFYETREFVFEMHTHTLPLEGVESTPN